MRLTYDDEEHKPHAFSNSFVDGPLSRAEDACTMGTVLSGGGGLYGTAQDYLAFLRGVLASSPQLHTQQSGVEPLLSDASFHELFRDVLSQKGKISLSAMMKGQTYHCPGLLEGGSGKLVGHSVGLCLNLKDSSIGRKAGSGCCKFTAACFHFGPSALTDHETH